MVFCNCLRYSLTLNYSCNEFVIFIISYRIVGGYVCCFNIYSHLNLTVYEFGALGFYYKTKFIGYHIYLKVTE